jgi:AcrR family transcriptional regulator
MVIIAADGLDSVTIARLARAMDLTVGALYRYFPSKTAILTAVTVRTLQAFTLKLEEAAGLPGDGCERLLNIASAHIDFCRHQPAARSSGALLVHDGPTISTNTSGDGYRAGKGGTIQGSCRCGRNRSDTTEA